MSRVHDIRGIPVHVNDRVAVAEVDIGDSPFLMVGRVEEVGTKDEFGLATITVRVTLCPAYPRDVGQTRTYSDSYDFVVIP